MNQVFFDLSRSLLHHSFKTLGPSYSAPACPEEEPAVKKDSDSGSRDSHCSADGSPACRLALRIAKGEVAWTKNAQSTEVPRSIASGWSANRKLPPGRCRDRRKRQEASTANASSAFRSVRHLTPTACRRLRAAWENARRRAAGRAARSREPSPAASGH